MPAIPMAGYEHHLPVVLEMGLHHCAVYPGIVLLHLFHGRNVTISTPALSTLKRTHIRFSATKADASPF